MDVWRFPEFWVASPGRPRVRSGMYTGSVLEALPVVTYSSAEEG